MKDLIVNTLPFALAVIFFFCIYFFVSKKKALTLLYYFVEWAEKDILGSKQGKAKKKKVLDDFYSSNLVPWYLKLIPRSVIDGWIEKALSILKTNLKIASELAESHKEEDKSETSAQDEEEG